MFLVISQNSQENTCATASFLVKLQGWGLKNKSEQIWATASEAVVRRCFVKKLFLEISQNSQENTCARASFLIKLQAAFAASESITITDMQGTLTEEIFQTTRSFFS